MQATNAGGKPPTLGVLEGVAVGAGGLGGGPSPAGAVGLPEAHPPEVIELADGDELDLRIHPVAKSGMQFNFTVEA